jgi:NADPH:quinone reductase-like Zn-dependent oxidoreductase
MKAVVYEKYGSPEVLQLKEVTKPMPKDHQMLIKVKAASVNSWDWDMLTGKPYLYRLLFGLFKPKLKILGADVSGVVEAVGNDVTHFKKGDEVMGDISSETWGGFAEYVCADEKYWVVKPASMTHEQAAAIPQAATLALQGLNEYGGITQGQKVLINGGGGGAGTFAIQLAKLYGAEVIVVDHTSKLALMKSLGADHVIDYTRENYTENGQRYDRILDFVASQSVAKYKDSLTDKGVFVMVGGKIATILQVAFLGGLFSWMSHKKIGLLVWKPNTQELEYLNTLFLEAKLTPIIHKTYPLEETSQALWEMGQATIQGKAVVKVDE